MFRTKTWEEYSRNYMDNTQTYISEDDTPQALVLSIKGWIIWPDAENIGTGSPLASGAEQLEVVGMASVIAGKGTEDE